MDRIGHPDIARRELRSFGRKRGRKISAHQQALLRELLPRVAVDLSRPAPTTLAELFLREGALHFSLPAVAKVGAEAEMASPDKAPTSSLPPVRRIGEGGIPTPVSDEPTREVWLEIGFGGAEHMLAQARANPDVGIIGCEPFEEGVVKALAAIDAERLGNVRLHADDARPLLRWLPPASLARVFMLFPDPWPKKRHVKRRLFSAPVLDELARVVRPLGELRFATDWGDYARHALYAAARQKSFAWAAASAADWRVRPPDWPQTRYESKALAQGRRCYFFRFIRQAAA